MNKYLILLLFTSLSINAQTSISGYMNPEDVSDRQRIIYLSQVIKKGLNATPMVKVIAKTTIDDDYFFKLNTILPQDQQLYFLHLADKNKKGKFRTASTRFLLANNDSIFFNKSPRSFENFTNTNSADAEWQKFNAFNLSVAGLKKGHKKFLNEIRSYSKDSLQILAVKLMTVQELNTKSLLDKDILLNKKYYSDLLIDLKQSDINPIEYSFLEAKLAELLIQETTSKYAVSFWLNLILGFCTVGLLLFIYFSKNSVPKIHPLSKQELIIKNLILEGNSNKEIAQELFISLSTVKSHITNIYQKLNVNGRHDLTTKYKNGTGTSS